MKDVFGYVAVILTFLLVVSFVLFFTFGSVDSNGKPAETVSFYRMLQLLTKIPEMMDAIPSQLVTVWDMHTDHFAVSSPDRLVFDEHGNPELEWGETYPYDFSPFDANESDNWFYRVAVGFFDFLLGIIFRLFCTFFVIVNNAFSVPFLLLTGIVSGDFIVGFDVMRAGPFGGVT